MTSTEDSTEQPDIPELSSLFEPNEDCICEFGDVVLVANDGFHPVEKLRVSSCILVMSSRVFKALFSKRFSEGQKGASRTCSEPFEVELQDAPRPLKFLCSILHNRVSIDEWGFFPTTNEVLDMAIIADKYDCAQSVLLQTDSILSQIRAGDPAPSWRQSCQTLQLAAAAYLLEQRRHFRELTAELVLTEPMIRPEIYPDQCTEILPDRLIPSLFNQQNVAMHEFAKQLTELVDDFQRACETAGQETLHLELVRKLKSEELWPLNYISHRPLQEILRSLKNLRLPVVALSDEIETRVPYKGRWFPGWPHIDETAWLTQEDEIRLGPRRMVRRRNRTCSVVSDAETVEIKQIDAPTHLTLIDRATKVENLCVGVCLDCIRDRECRKPHTRKWASDSSNCLQDNDHDVVSQGEMEAFEARGDAADDVHQDDRNALWPTFVYDQEYPGYWETCW